jgi:hypothetical protein
MSLSATIFWQITPIRAVPERLRTRKVWPSKMPPEGFPLAELQP